MVSTFQVQASYHRSRSPLSSKRLSSHDNSAAAAIGNDDASSDASSLAESVFRERKGLERPPPPAEVVAETPNATTASSNCGGGGNDSLNSSTASQVRKISNLHIVRGIVPFCDLYPAFLYSIQKFVNLCRYICSLSETLSLSFANLRVLFYVTLTRRLHSTL